MTEYIERACQDREYPDFGDFAWLEMKRYGVPNELFEHKVIGVLKSNTWVESPIGWDLKEVMHSATEKVARVVVCGISETHVYTVRVADIKRVVRRALAPMQEPPK